MSTGRITEAQFAINLVINSSHDLLMLKRSLTARLGPGKWGLPAGHIEEHESPEACSTRELKEEIGDDHRIYLLNRLGPLRNTDSGSMYEIHLFHYLWLGGNVTLNAEHTRYAWVSREIFREYDVMNGVDEDIALMKIWPAQIPEPPDTIGDS